MKQTDLNRLFFYLFLGVLLLTTGVDAQEDSADQILARSGYLLSAASNRLNILRAEITEIRRKKIGLSGASDPEICHLSMLITNLFWVETTCEYESLLLESLQNVTEGKKTEYYRIHYSRLQKVTLKNMYLNFKSTQSNFASIEDPEIQALSGTVKKELLKALRLLEEEIDILKDKVKTAN
jgi:hypothetical protein